MALSSRRSSFSYRQYTPTPAAFDRGAVRRRGVFAAAVRVSAPVREERRLAVEKQFAGHGADGGIRERCRELAERVRREYLTRVREHDDVVSGARHRRVQGQSLTTRRHGDDVDRVAERGELLQRVVGGSVGRDDDLSPVGRVIEIKEVVEARLEPRAFIPGGDDDRDGGHVRACASRVDRSRAEPRPHPQQRGVARVHVNDCRCHAPEEQRHPQSRHRVAGNRVDAHSESSRTGSALPSSVCLTRRHRLGRFGR
jgi:hypothetical protein